MIHSLHIIGSRQFGGAEHFFARLVSGLNQRHHEAAAVTRPNSPLCSVLTDDIPQTHVAMRNGWDIFSLLAIRRIIIEKQPKIVQTYMGRATRLTRVPSLSDSIHIARLGGYYKIRGYYEHAHAWVGNTRGLCDYLIRHGMSVDRVYHIGNFVEIGRPRSMEELRQCRRNLNIPEEAIVLFSLGRFNYQKGFEDLLDALSLLPHRIGSRPLYLLIAGDGPLNRSLRAQAESLGITQRVVWLGWQNDPDIFYALADVFVCSSRHETLGNVILEAWAHNLPVISTKAPGPMELIEDGQNGILVECRNPESLAVAIKKALHGGDSLWRELSAEGMKTILSSHTKEVIVSKYLEMYSELEKQHP